MPSQKLVDTLISHRVGVELFSKGQIKKIHALLQDVAGDVRSQLLENLPTSGRMTPNKRKALERLLKKVDGGITEAHAAINDQLYEALAEIGSFESGFSLDFLSAQAGQLGIDGGIDLELLDAKMLNQIIESEPLNGRYLKDWFQGLEIGHQNEIRRQVNIGMAEGESHDQIIARLMGKNNGSSTLGLMRGRAEMVVRTSVNHVTNRVHMETIDRNKDIFPKYQWISILDSRTTPICQGRHASVYQTGKGPIPPAHPSCRSTIIGLLKEDDGEDIPEYKDWLERQDPDMQERVLGPSRFKLFQQGVKADKFIAKDGTKITLAELATSNRAAFQKAGLGRYVSKQPEVERVYGTITNFKPVSDNTLGNLVDQDRIFNPETMLVEGTPEHAAHQRYIGPGYRSMNGYLRGVDPEIDPKRYEKAIDPENIKKIKTLQKMFDRSDARMPADAYLYRGHQSIHSLLPNQTMEISDLKGAIIRDKGFLSTATLRDGADMFLKSGAPGQAVFRYRVKKGHPAMAGSLREDEIILPPGTAQKITKVHFNGDFWEIEADILPFTDVIKKDAP
jgi:SPP1 gp7 family putative phage head morphogenesis protein